MFWYILTALILPVVFYFIFVKPFNYWKNRGVAQYHFLITLREIFLGFIPYRSIAENIIKIYNDFPDYRYCGIYQLYKPTLFVRDPELLKQITVKDFDYFVDHVQFVPEDTEPIWQKNLFSLKGDKWRDMRITLSPSFTSSKMKIMFSLINDYAKEFIKYFEEHSCELKSIEMKDTFTRFTNDIIATTAFGYNCDSLRNPNNEFYLMGKKLTTFQGFWTNIKFFMVFFFPKLSKKLGLRMFSKEITNFFVNVIKNNIETREKNNIVRLDMIHLLMEARKGRTYFDKINDNSLDTGFTSIDGSLDKKEEKRKKEQLTDMDITAQALIFFFAGFDSVSTLMCFMAYELAINVDIQERLQREIDSTLEKCDGAITYDILSKMRYMDMVISETMRKWSPGIVVDRQCSKSYTIEPVKDGEVPVTINKGQILWIPIFGIHRDPNIYPDPERFNPERFNGEDKSNLSAYTFLPFGVGPRSCIGNRFALMETKIAFLYILSKFTLNVTKKTKIPVELAKSQFQLNSKNGFWLGLKIRTKVQSGK